MTREPFQEGQRVDQLRFKYGTLHEVVIFFFFFFFLTEAQEQHFEPSRGSRFSSG